MTPLTVHMLEHFKVAHKIANIKFGPSSIEEDFPAYIPSIVKNLTEETPHINIEAAITGNALSVGMTIALKYPGIASSLLAMLPELELGEIEPIYTTIVEMYQELFKS